MNQATSLTIAEDVFETLHPLCFFVKLPGPLGELELSADQRALLSLDAAPSFPHPRDEALRQQVRDCLRLRGYKPTGRGKPASEYLIGAFEKGFFSPTTGINAAVDLCNLTSLHSGLPISVVDRDLLKGRLRIEWAPKETSYPFNPSGQLIDASGLVALCDEEGVSGTPVKDSQRTKTSPVTRSLLTVIWVPNSRKSHGADVLSWYKQQHQALSWDCEPAS